MTRADFFSGARESSPANRKTLSENLAPHHTTNANTNVVPLPTTLEIAHNLFECPAFRWFFAHTEKKILMKNPSWTFDRFVEANNIIFPY